MTNGLDICVPQGGYSWGLCQGLDVQRVLAEAGTHTGAEEQRLQVAKLLLQGLEASVQEVISPQFPLSLFKDCCDSHSPLRSLPHCGIIY
jgi:hypothetical protein